VDVLSKSKSWIQYLINRKDEYSLHSPFAFELYNYLKENNHSYTFDIINKIRNGQAGNNQLISVYDLGAGSQFNSNNKIKLSSITSTASIPHKYGCILFKLVNKFSPENIVELGTGTGISTLYLALASPANVFTIEGNPALTEIAKTNFERAGCRNITAITGNFTDQLPLLFSKLNKVDFAFIDGNHRYEPTIEYFNLIKEKSHENTIMVFDDIHWSKEMEQAWQKIISDKDVTVSMDFFRFGIVFFKKELSKEHYILTYP
jgi:predicted O-methyltransferase YrrM